MPPPAFADELPQEVQDILQDSPADITDAAGWTLADIAALLGDWIVSGFQPTLHFAAQSAGYLLLAGLLGLLGVGADDTDEDVEYLAGKLVRLRIFDDAQGVMNLDVRQVGGQVLVVSQFTLLASTRKGNRPSYIKAAPEAVSRPMYGRFTARVAELLGREVMTGEFGADMQVALVNDGPVTIWVDSKMRDC